MQLKIKINYLLLIFVILNFLNIVLSISIYHNDKIIQKAVLQCCPIKLRNCCLKNLRSDTMISCDNDSTKSLQYAICLEHFFYNNSIIETGAHECCWLLSSKKCQKKCSRNLQKPTMPLEEKFTFTDDCPRLEINQQRQNWLNLLRAKGIISSENTKIKSNENNDNSSFEINEFDCLWQTKYKLQDCFSSCLVWMRKKKTATKNSTLQQDEFNPRLHCNDYKAFTQNSPCFFVIE